MLISTGTLENPLSQGYQCRRAVIILILLVKGCCTPVSRCATQLGVLRAWWFGEVVLPRRRNGWEFSALDFSFIFFSIPAMRACSTRETLCERATQISQRAIRDREAQKCFFSKNKVLWVLILFVLSKVKDPLCKQLERRELLTKWVGKTYLAGRGVECNRAVCMWQQKDVRMWNCVAERNLDYSWWPVKLVTNSRE